MPSEVSQMVADREAGTPGPWRFQIETDQDGYDEGVYVTADIVTVHWSNLGFGTDENDTRVDDIIKANASRIARPAPQPAADTRVVGPQCCMCGKLDLSTVEDDGGAECELHDGRWVCSSDCYDRAIIGTAQSDKIAEAALIEWLHGETLDIVTGEPLFDGAHIDVTAGEVRRRLAALAGKGAK